MLGAEQVVACLTLSGAFGVFRFAEPVAEMADSRRIRDLLQKTEHYDADERFMATNDLIRELEKVEGFLDNLLQEPVRNAVLKLLDDKGKDVSTIAVKCLSTLVKKFNPDQVSSASYRTPVP